MKNFQTDLRDGGGSLVGLASGTIVFANRADGATGFLGLGGIGEKKGEKRMISKPVCERSEGFSGEIASSGGFLLLV